MKHWKNPGLPVKRLPKTDDVHEITCPELRVWLQSKGDPLRGRAGALRAEPVALSQAKPLIAIAGRGR